MKGILQTLIASMNALRSETDVNIQKTLEIQNELSKSGDFPGDFPKKAQERVDSIPKDRRRMVAGASLGERGAYPRGLGVGGKI